MSLDSFDIGYLGDAGVTFGVTVPVADGSNKSGDAYINTATGDCYLFDGSAWIPSGTITGSGGSDWTTQVKTSSQTFSGAGPSDITDLSGFTPVADSVWEFEAKLIVASSVATTGPRPSVLFPTGTNDIAYEIRQPNTAFTVGVVQYGGPSAPVLATAAPVVTTGYLSAITGIVSYGATPGAGNVLPQMRSEVGGSSVFVRSGSMFKYRRVA